MTEARPPASTSASPLVLLHGAWHDSSCWSGVAGQLREHGLQVIAPDLPGHGLDPTPLTKVSLKRYVKAVIALLETVGEPVTLVGHSMAGMIVAQCCSERPELIRNAVYLCAYLPRDGESVFDLISLNRSHEPFIAIELALQMSADKRTCTIAPEQIIPLFYSLAPPELATAAACSVSVQASLPLASRVTLTADTFDQVPRTYICFTKDKVIPLHHQRRMLTRQPCQTLLQMDTDHSPFVSSPAELSALLASIAQ